MSYPQAFPNYHGGYSRAGDGMTLRDYFAAKALNGLLSCYTDETRYYEEVVETAYELADAMLKARDGNS